MWRSRFSNLPHTPISNKLNSYKMVADVCLKDFEVRGDAFVLQCQIGVKGVVRPQRVIDHLMQLLDECHRETNQLIKRKVSIR